MSGGIRLGELAVLSTLDGYHCVLQRKADTSLHAALCDLRVHWLQLSSLS